ncbi:MAG: poly-gamma-glutamate biosynthesis protein PgsC/CapC [Enhygromyxa sp.]
MSDGWEESVTFVLELLPARGLDQSMLLPVLVGLWVVLLFTETFGWVFAGAIVPGYLASVLIIQPVTGAIVIFESLVTLAIAAGLAKGLSKTDAWTRFFGRERFFLILAVSLIVRVHDHAWFAPWAIATLDARLGTVLETQQEFYSVGLVLVPLTANMLWKPAVHRGLLQLGVQVAITYWIVAALLLPHTNLTLSSVELAYENTAINFIGHAKAHIILLSAALLAAHFNLSYGWDFNGILVPALLAMLWLTPLKLLATLGEAIAVVYLVRGFLRLPLIRHLDFEGPRKIALTFTLAFVWKLALGFTLAPIFPELEIRDAYGFGYLLSSLLAVKMLGLRSVRSVLLPSLTTSAAGFMIGSAAGFVLDIAAPQLPTNDPISRPLSSRLTSSPLGVMTLARMQIEVQREDPPPPSQAELHQLQLFWGEVARLERTLAGASRRSPLGPLRRRGSGLNLQLVELGSHPSASGGQRAWFGIVEQDGPSRRGFATGLVIPGARGPVLVVPRPASEAPIAEVAAIACRRVDCRAVLVAGREHDHPGSSINPRPLELAMAAFEGAQIVILRADAEAEQRGLAARLLSERPLPDRPRAATRIHPLRGYFDLAELWPDYELDWRPRRTTLRAPPGDGDFVLVRTTRAQLEAMLLAGAHELTAALDDAPPVRHDPAELLASLAWMHADREPPGLEGAGYVPPSNAELSLLEREIVEPLVSWAQHSEPGVGPPPMVTLWAAVLDYELAEFGDCRSPKEGVGVPAGGPDDHPPSEAAEASACAVMLRERWRRSTAGWGTLVLRRGPGTLPSTIEVPRPHREFETWRVGAELWQLSQTFALLIAGADGLPLDPLPDEDPAHVDPAWDPRRAAPSRPHASDLLAPSPDPVRPGNLGTPFQAFHQALDRRSIRGRAAEVVQIRGLASFRLVDRDLVVGVGQPGSSDEDQDQACWRTLDPRLAALARQWGRCRIADGSADLYLLSGAGTPQLEYSRELRHREFRVLWLSAGLRDRFASDNGLVELRGLRQVGFSPEPRRELELLLAPLPAAEAGLRLDPLDFDRALELAEGFAATSNLHLLRELQELDERASDLRIEAGIGQEWGRPFLLIEWAGEQLGARALINLDHELEQRVELSLAELRGDPLVHLRIAALARPRALVVRELELEGGEVQP